MCDQWAHEFELKTARDRSNVAPGLAAEGIAAFRFLARPAQRHALLRTDLHTGNVLAAEREPWLVIDPKPYVGDLTYDVHQHMLNCDKRLRAGPGDFVARMADLASLDAGRLRSGCSPAVSKSRPDGPLSARSQCLSRRSRQPTANSDLTAITSRSEPADIPAWRPLTPRVPREQTSSPAELTAGRVITRCITRSAGGRRYHPGMAGDQETMTAAAAVTAGELAAWAGGGRRRAARAHPCGAAGAGRAG